MDVIDHQIIAHLQKSARSSFTTIGAEVGLSAPAVKRRVDRLEQDHVITGYHASIDQPSATEALVELFCRGKTGPDHIRSMVDHIPEVIAAYTVTGEADALVHLRCATPSDLEPVIESIRNHPSTERTKSVLILSKLI
jgi:DNA-binding Lrp family transcriptional regulator